MKRAFIAAGIVTACVAILAAGAIAFFTREDTTRSVISTGSLGFDIYETTASGEAFPVQGVSVLPGDTVSKIVTGKNTGNHPLYVRIKLIKGVTGKDLPAEEQLQLDINEEDWTFRDGYYYYNKVLEPKEETTPLFTTVTVDGQAVDNDYLGTAFFLTIDGSAVQSENNGSDVFSAVGWSEKQ